MVKSWSSDLASMNTADLVRRFEEAAIAYGIAESQEDIAEADKQDQMKYAIIGELRRRGREDEAELLRLLHHENVHVRAESAMWAIHFAPSEAVPVLAQIAGLRGRTGYYARQALNRHRVGADRSAHSTAADREDQPRDGGGAGGRNAGEGSTMDPADA